MSKAIKISHVGVAVSDLSRAIADFGELFELEQVQRAEMGDDTDIAFLKIGDSEIELLAPKNSQQGVISKFLQEKGEGIHHIAITVPDVEAAIAQAKERGFKLVDSKPRKGARGAVAAFVHPKGFHGILLEFYSK